jgi:hypothetical protein
MRSSTTVRHVTSADEVGKTFHEAATTPNGGNLILLLLFANMSKKLTATTRARYDTHPLRYADACRHVIRTPKPLR